MVSHQELHHASAALIVAHPGHELRVHGWLERAHPLAFVLTTGDGAQRTPRIHTTRKILDAAGASTSSVCGRFSDGEIYAALLAGHHDLFLSLVAGMVQEMIDARVEYVVADAEEGFNPSHDVCSYLAQAAAQAAGAVLGRPIRGFDFPLVGAPDACPDALRDESLRLELDDDAVARKLEAARNYPELKEEVNRALETNGAHAFRVECLRPALARTDAPGTPPEYEAYGERRVAAGLYTDVIRYEQHVRPLKEALFSHAFLST